MADLIQIPIAKAGKNVMFEVDPDDINNLPAEVFAMVVKEGLKVVLNSRMSKLAAPSKLEGKAAEDNKAAALAKAEENLNDLKAGKLTKKTSAAKAAGVDRAVMTEAMRLAKEVVKNECRKAGIKISHVPASEITAAAKVQVEGNPQYIEDAKANIAARANVLSVVDIKSLVKESPKLVAEAEARKADRKSQLSAKQAGKTDKRTAKVPPRRPQSESHTAH